MGLLDSVLGSVLGGQAGSAPAGPGGLGDVLGGLRGAQGQENGGLATLLPVVVGMLANDGQGGGGLGGLMDKFNQAGLGDLLQSWIATGPNPAISGEQLGQVLGVDTVDQIAAQWGVAPGEAAGQLAQALPGLIDRLTPEGHAPQGGFGSADALPGALTGMLQKR